MANILLGVTGSVAAIRTPMLMRDLRSIGHNVKIVATHAALYFFDPVEFRKEEDLEKALGHVAPSPLPPFVFSGNFFTDEAEWPGRNKGRLYQRDDPVLHIELRRWADLLLIAPLDANTLAKLATGLADNCLTCVWRAWDIRRPVILAPAMNTLMWEHPLTARHLRQLAADDHDEPVPAFTEDEELLTWINANCAHLSIVPPISKRLACGDMGVGAMAAVDEIVRHVQARLGNVIAGLMG
jgi:phosphopantothenoylcysteine decarboxylase